MRYMVQQVAGLVGAAAVLATAVSFIFSMFVVGNEHAAREDRSKWWFIAAVTCAGTAVVAYVGHELAGYLL